MSEQAAVTFMISWRGSASAELFYLIDGGVVVPLAGKRAFGHGSISINYLASDSDVHCIEWGLVFSGRTLHGLAAAVSLKAGIVHILGSSEEESQRWIGKAQVCARSTP